MAAVSTAEATEKWLSACSDEAQQPPLVEQLEQVTFHRVAGHAGKGSVLDKGPPGSWYSETVGAPTIHFDGELCEWHWNFHNPLSGNGFRRLSDVLGGF